MKLANNANADIDGGAQRFHARLIALPLPRVKR